MAFTFQDLFFGGGGGGQQSVLMAHFQLTSKEKRALKTPCYWGGGGIPLPPVSSNPIYLFILILKSEITKNIDTIIGKQTSDISLTKTRYNIDMETQYGNKL